MIDKIYLDEEEINEVTLQAVASAIYDLYDGEEYVTIPRTAVKAAKYAVAYAEQLIHDKLKYEREKEPEKDENPAKKLKTITVNGVDYYVTNWDGYLDVITINGKDYIVTDKDITPSVRNEITIKI